MRIFFHIEDLSKLKEMIEDFLYPCQIEQAMGIAPKMEHGQEFPITPMGVLGHCLRTFDRLSAKPPSNITHYPSEVKSNVSEL